MTWFEPAEVVLDWAEAYRRLSRDREDLKAWEAVEQHVRGWARPALRRYGWEAAEEAVADTCSAVAVAFPRARGADTFKGFVFGHYLNARRRLLAERRLLATSLDDVEPGGVHDPLPTPDEQELLRRCMGELPARERRAIELRYFDDAPGAAIAEALGVQEGNARRIVFNALARLRECARRLWPRGRG